MPEIYLHKGIFEMLAKQTVSTTYSSTNTFNFPSVNSSYAWEIIITKKWHENTEKLSDGRIIFHNGIYDFSTVIAEEFGI